ncbi:DNA polymerase III subunit beta [Rhizobium sp. 1AS11]|uniref:DNA polymerase III subunit beta n=1 Tax=Rhizobium acaciae TaxID=2989736 RepID=UPI002222BC6B|nr:DNA polymerase III subunit beta [Rhizobium acaciae]MCW1412155.1 DNA polymerase III subunit beta [Rhizobium acaciae]MCW1744170.1 DNA polymerase III subunit beta [Rhizobium acaciae]
MGTHIREAREMLDTMTPPPAPKPGKINGCVDARAFTSRLKLLNKFGERDWGSIPILGYVTITFDGLGSRMTIGRYGIDLNLEATLAAEGTGSTSLPAKTLLAFVSNADGDTISFEKRSGDDAVTVKCGRYNASLYPLDPTDAPRLPVPMVFARGFPMPEGVLSRLLGMTVPFMSTEETRYYLNGVCFELEENLVRAIATDGHRLGTSEAKLPAPSLEAWDMRPIVPISAVSALAGIIGKAQCIARFHGEFVPGKEFVDERLQQKKTADEWKRQVAQFSSDDWTITTRLIDGNFPDWRRVVPKSQPTNAFASINVADIRRFSAMLGGGKEFRAVKLAPKDEATVQLSTSGGSEGKMTGEARAEIGGTFEPIGVNAKYLAAIAKALGSDWIDVEIEGPSSPFTMRAKDSPAGDFAILMPMRV